MAIVIAGVVGVGAVVSLSIQFFGTQTKSDGPWTRKAEINCLMGVVHGELGDEPMITRPPCSRESHRPVPLTRIPAQSTESE
jgi:hypothetical protein